MISVDHLPAFGADKFYCDHSIDTFSIFFFFHVDLQNSKVFSCILMASLCGIIGILIAIASIRGNLTTWQSKQWLPKGLPGVSLNLIHNFIPFTSYSLIDMHSFDFFILQCTTQTGIAGKQCSIVDVRISFGGSGNR